MKEKGPLRAIGCMSGTSLDGVDAALIETDGETITGFGPTAYRAYGKAERAVLRAALGRWPGETGVAEAAAVVEAAHVELLAQMPPADLVGFHGQTLAHEPAGRGTHQVGSGTRLAEATGRRIVWDMRSADVAAGGQGAPLAPAYHFACARRFGADAPMAFLNLGGVGNLTWLDPRMDDPFAPGAMLAFDTGPANAPLDDLMQARRGVPRDENGALARQGTPRLDRLADYHAAPFFELQPPKSLDREDFAMLADAVAPLSDADAAATLVAAMVEGVARGLVWCPASPTELLVTGGGRRNPAVMEALARALPCPVAPVEDRALDGDMIEAQAFGFLAVRALRGLPITGPSSTGCPAPMTGGQVSGG
ncbi:MAG: anhydro-N-acetylmuramic acid kinase [Rhodobacteraceae bacterium]|nr:anhydro-N-acetylmuramic acid kinase [Paracoccaceae bacterium]